jgi:hypothetical protein
MAAQHPDDDKIPGRYIGECAICLGPMNAGSINHNRLTSLRCGHIFHCVCYSQAAGVHQPKCPKCRADVVGFTAIPENLPDITNQNNVNTTPEEYVKQRIESLKRKVAAAKCDKKELEMKQKEEAVQTKKQILTQYNVKIQCYRGIPVYNGAANSEDQKGRIKVLKLVCDMSHTRVAKETETKAKQVSDLERIDIDYQAAEQERIRATCMMDELKEKLAAKKKCSVQEIELMMMAQLKNQRDSRQLQQSRNSGTLNQNFLKHQEKVQQQQKAAGTRRGRSAEANNNPHQVVATHQQPKPKNSADQQQTKKVTNSNSSSNNTSSSELLSDYLKNEQSRQDRSPIQSQSQKSKK